MHNFICSTAKLKGLKYCLSPLLFCLEVRSLNIFHARMLLWGQDINTKVNLYVKKRAV